MITKIEVKTTKVLTKTLLDYLKSINYNTSFIEGFETVELTIDFNIITNNVVINEVSVEIADLDIKKPDILIIKLSNDLNKILGKTQVADILAKLVNN